MGKAMTGLRAVGVLAAGALVLSACGGGSSGGGSSAGTSQGQKGGTLTFLTQAKQILHLDPQRNYTGEDLAFVGGYMQRTLTAFKLSPDDKTASQLVPDLATDLGTATNGGKTWSFTLRDGVKFQDGSPITCADVKYGVSRTFATTSSPTARPTRSPTWTSRRRPTAARSTRARTSRPATTRPPSTRRSPARRTTRPSRST